MGINEKRKKSDIRSNPLITFKFAFFISKKKKEEEKEKNSSPINFNQESGTKKRKIRIRSGTPAFNDPEQKDCHLLKLKVTVFRIPSRERKEKMDF